MIVKHNSFLQWLIWGLLVAVICAIALAYFLDISQKSISQKPLFADDSSLPVFNILGDFSLTNQFGAEVKLDHLKGKPWVANIFFTRCPSICAQMTQKMKAIQEAVSDPSLNLISITTDPIHDRPDVLRRYAERFGADTNRWLFLTGDPASISRVIQKELLLILQENPEASRQSELDLYTHSPLIVLIDAASRIRATYESMGTNVIESLIADLSKLD